MTIINQLCSLHAKAVEIGVEIGEVFVSREQAIEIEPKCIDADPARGMAVGELYGTKITLKPGAAL